MYYNMRAQPKTCQIPQGRIPLSPTWPPPLRPIQIWIYTTSSCASNISSSGSSTSSSGSSASCSSSIRSSMISK